MNSFSGLCGNIFQPAQFGNESLQMINCDGTHTHNTTQKFQTITTEQMLPIGAEGDGREWLFWYA